MMQEELPSSLDSLLNYMGMNDPDTRRKAQLVAAFMNQQEAVAREEAAADKARLMQREAARRKIRRLQREREILAERNEALAAALGACQFCWGQDAACEACEGQGSPGSIPPDEEFFMELVTPVLKLLGLVQAEEPPVRKT